MLRKGICFYEGEVANGVQASKATTYELWHCLLGHSSHHYLIFIVEFRTSLVVRMLYVMCVVEPNKLVLLFQLVIIMQ